MADDDKPMTPEARPKTDRVVIDAKKRNKNAGLGRCSDRRSSSHSTSEVNAIMEGAAMTMPAQVSVDAKGEQLAVLLYLRSAAAFAPAGIAHEIDTHAASIFLVGDRAWKLKRAVRFGYLDFTTAAKREEALKAELKLNRRTTVGLYLAIHPITRDVAGQLAIDGTGETIDWLLEMRRFPDDALLADMADRGKISFDIAVRLADRIVAFHALAASVTDGGAKARFLTVVEENAASLAVFADILPMAAATGLCEAHRAAALKMGTLLDSRGSAGRVRHVHGDLHLANIAMIDGEPTMFDCLEFSETLATTDVLYDLAFLLMDLWHRGLRSEANMVFNRYLDRSPVDEDGVALIALFVSVRATIRAHVMAAQAARADAAPNLALAARAYLDLAITTMMPGEASVLAIGGFSGTGKSSVARALAGAIGRVPGARIVRSDVLRKQLAGVMPETRLNVGQYTQESSQRVYAAVNRATAAMLAAGQSVVVDAVFAQVGERAACARTAKSGKSRFKGLWLVATDSQRYSRVSERCADASDADTEVALAQANIDPGLLGDWIPLSADAPLDDVSAAAVAILRREED
ncbi:bifunctional aminoglycoside phosphotransferase/ATP-binding protein [soil metagenome]